MRILIVAWTRFLAVASVAHWSNLFLGFSRPDPIKHMASFPVKTDI